MHSQSDPGEMNHHYRNYYLRNCSLTTTASLELVQSLSPFRHLTELNVGRNKLGEAGHQLSQSIKSWRNDPPLQVLSLYNCSLPAAASLELVQSQSSCRYLIELDLRGNKLGEAGQQLAQSIRSWGDEPPLQILTLSNCSLTSYCNHLSLYNLCHHARHLTRIGFSKKQSR